MTKPTAEPKLKRYPSEVKNHARARWKAGDSLDEIAASVSAPKSTVQGWMQNTPRDLGQQVVLAREAVPPSVPNNNQPPQVNIDEVAAGLVHDYRSAVGSIARLIATGDGSDWIKGQGAGELAVLAGVLSDKLLRVLGSYRRIDSSPAIGVERGAD